MDDVTRLLARWHDGEPAALSELMPLVYQELHALAAHYLRNERSDHTLQPTALVNEAYLRLIDTRGMHWQNRAHFLAMAARVMRRILVDFARSKQFQKRGGDAVKLSLDDVFNLPRERAADLIALDDALDELKRIDERKSLVVELRYFAGFSVEETAQILGVSSDTVIRDWKLAKSWLYQQIRREMSNDD